MVKEELILWNEYPCGANGQIYSHFTKKYLKGATDKDGYVRVMLKCVDGKYRTFQWHRVIYTYFYGTIPEGMQVNHIREFEKTNNALSNLNLMTPKENINYGTCIERRATKQRGISRPYIAERDGKPVVAVDEEGNVIYEFASTAEAGRNGFNQSNVSACCRGERKKHKGLRWYYA